MHPVVVLVVTEGLGCHLVPVMCQQAALMGAVKALMVEAAQPLPALERQLLVMLPRSTFTGPTQLHRQLPPWQPGQRLRMLKSLCQRWCLLTA